MAASRISQAHQFCRSRKATRMPRLSNRKKAPSAITSNAGTTPFLCRYACLDSRMLMSLTPFGTCRHGKTRAQASPVTGVTPKPGKSTVAHPVRHVPGRHVLARGLHIGRRIVEEDVGAERVEERTLVATAEEQRLVDAHAPLAQGEDHALVRGCGAGGYQGRADRRVFGGERGLQVMQRGEEAAERTHRQRLGGVFGFAAMERFQAFLARHPLALVT